MLIELNLSLRLTQSDLSAKLRFDSPLGPLSYVRCLFPRVPDWYDKVTWI